LLQGFAFGVDQRDPVPISVPNSQGAMMLPTAVPAA
jgi:hypothetical protein